MPASHLHPLQKMSLRSLRVDVAAHHHKKAFRILALAGAIVYFGRSFVASFVLGPMPAALMLSGAVINLGLYVLGHRTSLVKPLSLTLVVLMLAIELGLVLLGATHFIQFFLFIPLGITIAAFLVGMISAVFVAAASGVVFYLMLHSDLLWVHANLILTQGNAFRYRFLAQLIGSELFIVFIVYLFQDLLAKSEEDIQMRRIEEARLIRRSVIAEAIGKAAHELNNPLSILDAAFIRLRFHRGNTDPSLQQANLRFMADSIERLNKVLNNIQTFVEGGADEPYQLIPSEDLLVAFCQSTEEKRLIYGANLQTQNLIPGVKINCRLGQLHFVLQVLLENALDAMQGPEKNLRFTLSGVDTRVKLELRDNGVGIPPINIERVFTPFFSSKDIGKSIGMNLSISRVLIQEQGGTLEFENVPEGGTSFTILLPQAQAGAKDA